MLEPKWNFLMWLAWSHDGRQEVWILTCDYNGQTAMYLLIKCIYYQGYRKLGQCYMDWWYVYAIAPVHATLASYVLDDKDKYHSWGDEMNYAPKQEYVYC